MTLLKRFSLIILLVLALTGLAAVAVSFSRQLACEGQLINNNVNPTTPQQIAGDRIIGQSFVAPRPNLNRIDLFFQTYGRKNTHDVTLRLLAAPENGSNPLQGLELYRTTFNAADVSDLSWRTFTFPPIPDSGGKPYFIALESPQSTEGNAVTVGGIERDVYTAGSAFLGPVPVPADITFRTCYALSIAEKLSILGQQLIKNRPSLWGDLRFYLLLLLLYLLILLGIFVKLIKMV
ncbi:MAG: hypothetical protein HS126_30535 [Anaerolineales bacterium]|nr:hypothetical protein [Anaerolineales bacterium]